jgi:hypothetical protein
MDFEAVGARPDRSQESHRRRRARVATLYACESLEQRQLLSTIVWANRGVLSGPNSDRVNDVFGPIYAGQVRPLIDAVLQSWSRVISNFNYPGGGNTYNMTIQFAASGTSLGANAGPTSTASDGKPLTGSMTIGRGGDGPDTDVDIDGDGVPDPVGDGVGWFVDTTPFDNSEFESYNNNGFAGYNTDPASPAANLGDLYEVTLHEMGHAMGLLPTAQIQARSTNINTSTPQTPSPGSVDTIDAPASTPPSTYWRFDGAHVKTLETSYDSGGQSGTQFNANGSQHHAPAGASATVNGVTYLGSDDLMTPYYSNNQRRLISDTDAWMLADAYGYSITLPSTFGTFYDTLDADGTLRINPPGNGNDLIALSHSGSNLVVGLQLGAPVAGADITGFITSNFTASAVKKIIINAGGGNDDIRIGYVGSAAVTVNGGDGNDSVEFSILDKNLDLIGAGPVTINGDGGNNTIDVYDNSNTRADSYLINSNGMSRNGWAGFSLGTGSEQVSLTTGSGNNPLSVTSTNANQNIFLYSAGGADSVTVGGTGTAQSIFGDIEIHNAPNFSSLTVDDTNDFGSRNIVIDNSGTLGVLTGITGPIGGAIRWANSDISSVTVNISQFGDGTVDVRAMSRPLTIHSVTVGNQGANYAVSLGNSTNGMQSIISTVSLIAAYGQNQSLTFDDSADTGGRTTTLTRSSLNGDYFVSGLTQNTITFRDFGSFTLRQGSGADGFTAGGASQGGYDNDLPMTVQGNGGNDTYTLTTFNNWGEGLGGTFTFPVMFDGGTGYNSLSINDAARTATGYQFYADRFYSRVPTGFPVGSDFNYDNLSSIGVTCGNGNDSFAVYSTSSDIPAGSQITVVLSGGNDTVGMYPHDAQGNLTINGTIGIVGGTGTDTMIFDDTAASGGINYSFSNPFGAGTQDVFGIGAAGMGYTSDFETATLKGGDGADTFAVGQYKSNVPLAIYGGGGDDTLNLGGNNLPANITIPSGSFLFDGQAGFDRFNLNNGSEISQWTYTGGMNVEANRGSPAFGYDILFQGTHNEETTVNAGPGADTFVPAGIGSGTHVVFNGAGGNDSFLLSQSSTIFSLLKSKITFDAGDPAVYGILGGGSVAVAATFNTTPLVVHLTDTTIGAFPGDNLLGAGGSVEFLHANSLSLTTGSGADTVYAAPNATATVSIVAGNPTTAPGDTLNLALASAVGYSVNPTSATAGNVTSSNLKTLTYSGFESGPNVDDVAPAVAAADINVDGLPAAAPPASGLPDAPSAGASSGGPSLDIQFSEDIALLLGTGAIQLTNLTTGMDIPQDYLAVTYNPATQIAHFTFPGYESGILPDGNHHGNVLMGSTDDLYGNALAADAPFDFFVLTADANHDRTVDTLDFDALATNFNQAGMTFSQGDFNYDGTINALDFNALATMFGTYLAPQPSAAPTAPLAAHPITPGNAAQIWAPLRTDLFGNDLIEQWKIL